MTAPPLPPLPPGVPTIFGRALAESPEARYPSAGAFVAALTAEMVKGEGVREEAHEARSVEGMRTPAASIVSPPPAGLTAREVEVLRLVGAGRSNLEMAEILCRSERTIERHLESIYRKIAARNRADATIRRRRAVPGADSPSA